MLFLLALSRLSFASTIAVSINPYYLMVKEIVGEKAEVFLIIKPGVDPHSFSPTVKDVKAISRADLIIANGLGLDEFYLRGYKNVLYLGEKVPSEILEGEDHHGVNPHIWLSPDLLARYIIPSIVEEITKLDRANDSFYKERAERLINSLKDISKRFDELLQSRRNSMVVLDHPSYFYLFKKYGIKILSAEEGHGKQPTISHIKKIIEEAQKSNLIGIFVGPQFNKSAIEVISRELKRSYHILDPIGIEAKGITELFEKAYRTISEALDEG
ncbi:MAG: zinc ABC transporter substrate-binding protein [Synergistetes bacterium]|nr:zinc ABC transporter substrate-binding protein [Synergistota bacterium]